MMTWKRPCPPQAAANKKNVSTKIRRVGAMRKQEHTIGTTDGNEVVDGRAGNTVGDANTSRLQGQAPLISALDGSVVVLGDLVSSNNNDDLLGIVGEGTNTRTGQVNNDNVTLLADSAGRGQVVLSKGGLTAELGLLAHILLGEDLGMQIVPAVLASLEVINKTDLSLLGMRNLY